MNDKHENEYAVYEMIGKVLHIRFKKMDRLDILAAESIVDGRMSYQMDQYLPILCDVREVRFVDTLAREYFSRMGSLFIKVLAFLAEPGINDVLGELYLENYYPQGAKFEFPSKVFTDRDAALEFIHETMEKDGHSPKRRTSV